MINILHSKLIVFSHNFYHKRARGGNETLLFSTEMIFAESESSNIKTRPNPNTYYGITKYFGEVFNSNNTIVRLPLLVSKNLIIK